MKENGQKARWIGQHAMESLLTNGYRIVIIKQSLIVVIYTDNREQVVEIFKRILNVFTSILVAISIIIAVLLGVAAYFVGQRTKVEYEYAYFNKEMDVDVIYSMEKRKRVKTFDMTKLEVLAPASSYHLDEYKNRNYKEADYSSRKPENAQNVYVMYIGGMDKVIFEPTPELVKAIANIAPRKVFTE